MTLYHLKIHLLSDTTFGRGDGVAGLVDQEVEHDRYGFPYLRGRTLKGLLREECDNLVTVMSEPERRVHWREVTETLFGMPGSGLDTISAMHVGDACLPEELRQVVALQFQQEQSRDEGNRLTKTDILNSLTAIRRQTAINPERGAADDRSLRSSRVVLRKLCFIVPLRFEVEPDEDWLSLLAVGTLALRRLGSGRNRGRGHVKCSLVRDSDQKDITKEKEYLDKFQSKVSV